MHQQAIAHNPEMRVKTTALHTAHVITVQGCAREGEEGKEIQKNKKRIQNTIVEEHLSTIPPNPILIAKPPEVHLFEEELSREARRTLAQLRAGKYPLLQEYLRDIGAAEDPSCPLCGQGEHNTVHLFQCLSIPTNLTPQDLWRRPLQAAELVESWRAALAAAEEA